jgi:hypothetical protein
MPNTVETTIAGLRTVVNAKSDAELARFLGVNQSTISSWRARGSVPQRFQRMLQDPENGVVDSREVGGEVRESAQAIALLRFTLLRQELARSRDVDRAMVVFSDLKPFWLVMHRAVHDLLSKIEALSVELRTAQALILQDDLRDPEATAERVAAHLSEDLADNPGIVLGPAP